MAIESFFIKEGIKETQIKDFLSKKFEKAEYSNIRIERTPLGTRIIVFANKPGLVIGKSGSLIREITDEIREKFGIENPMLDVKEIENPFLDAQVVATKIAKSIERGSFYKKVINFYLTEVMKNGAIGILIRVGGKLGGERGRVQKFKEGYVKYSGNYADNILDKGYAEAIVKLGKIGVNVSIMKDMPEDLSEKISGLTERIKEKIEIKPEKVEEQKKVEEKKPEKADKKKDKKAKKTEKKKTITKKKTVKKKTAKKTKKPKK